MTPMQARADGPEPRDREGCGFSTCPFFVGVLRLVDDTLVFDERLMRATEVAGCRNCETLFWQGAADSARGVRE